MSTGNYFEVDLAGQENIKNFIITETLTGTQTQTFYLKITQSSPGAVPPKNFLWSQITNIKWPGGTGPTLTATDDAIDILSFTTFDEGTTWYGKVEGQNF